MTLTLVDFYPPAKSPCDNVQNDCEGVFHDSILAEEPLPFLLVSVRPCALSGVSRLLAAVRLIECRRAHRLVAVRFEAEAAGADRGRVVTHRSRKPECTVSNMGISLSQFLVSRIMVKVVVSPNCGGYSYLHPVAGGSSIHAYHLLVHFLKAVADRLRLHLLVHCFKWQACVLGAEDRAVVVPVRKACGDRANDATRQDVTVVMPVVDRPSDGHPRGR